MEKKLTSFGSIVAVIGSILIFIGIAWLIAQNWHTIPSTLKIIILLAAISAAYISAVILGIKGYQRTKKALLLLGTLLYTLSIFLIAQIFSLDTTLQGTASLFLLCWMGVFVISYILESSLSLIVALIEFLIWIIIQFFAFSEGMRQVLSPGILAFCLLSAGLLWYGLSLLHRAKKHNFSRLYEWWTIFYFLAFTYVLSFQSLLSLLWPKEAIIFAAPRVFLTFMIIVAIVALSIGIPTAIRRKQVTKKELFSAASIVVVLIALISITALAANKLGNCNTKTCYDLETEEECLAAPANMECKWNVFGCGLLDCESYKTITDCEKEENCMWREKGCVQKSCADYRTEIGCNGAPSEFRCRWVGSICTTPNCWELRDKTTCEANTECKWRGWCDMYDPCTDYDNNYEECSQHAECKWFNTGNTRWQGRNIPTIVWVVWIIINIGFLAIILSFLAYGTWQKKSKIINLAIVFFALDIVTRYIGFIMDLWGYTSLSIIFITGGIVLLLGGWLIEKWRRKLIEKAAK